MLNTLRDFVKAALRPDSARKIITYFSAYFDAQLHCANHRSFIFLENGHLSSSFCVYRTVNEANLLLLPYFLRGKHIRKVPNMAQANRFDFIMYVDVSF